MSQRIEAMPESEDSREVQFSQRKFPLASVLVPVLFLFLHQIMLNAMAYLRIFLYARKSGLAGDELMPKNNNGNKWK